MYVRLCVYKGFERSPLKTTVCKQMQRDGTQICSKMREQSNASSLHACMKWVSRGREERERDNKSER